MRKAFIKAWKKAWKREKSGYEEAYESYIEKGKMPMRKWCKNLTNYC